MTERLTSRYDDGYKSTIDIINNGKVVAQNTLYAPAIDKLGLLEDIEDKLGVGLETIFKAITQGIYVKTKNGSIIHVPTVSFKEYLHAKMYVLFYRPYSHVHTKDYGITWALTKEELEEKK